MKPRPTVLILFGGQSAEHEVSILSAANISDALGKAGYATVHVYITLRGMWYHVDDFSGFLVSDAEERLAALHTVFLVPSADGALLMRTDDCVSLGRVEVVYPVLHGPYGEDGTVQGLSRLLDLPCVGAGVTGSAVGMDKDVMKRLLQAGGVPVPSFLVYEESMREGIDFHRVSEELGAPVFVKPANLGSSVGISMAADEDEFKTAVQRAFQFDRKIIIEEYIRGREIECSVLGNEDPAASLPGEIRPRHQFYSYDAKYVDDEGAELIIPARLDEKVLRRVQELAVRGFRLLCCEGLARMDFFVRENGEVLINEINTLPGFTNISMYPKLWEASGVPQPELVDRLVGLAVESFEKNRTLRRERQGA
jgi:D-alanine-D-alanine ligase